MKIKLEFELDTEIIRDRELIEKLIQVVEQIKDEIEGEEDE